MDTVGIFLRGYISPAGDRSILKNIPISELENVRKWLKDRGMGKTYRFRFRGPRPRGYQAYLPKQMATHFAVYLYG